MTDLRRPKHRTYKRFTPPPARKHVLGSGAPKKAYDDDEVHMAAAGLRAIGRDVEPYRCDMCGFWHFGRRPKHMRFNEQDLLELGERVEALLRCENTKDRQFRVDRISERVKGGKKISAARRRKDRRQGP